MWNHLTSYNKLIRFYVKYKTTNLFVMPMTLADDHWTLTWHTIIEKLKHHCAVIKSPMKQYRESAEDGTSNAKSTSLHAFLTLCAHWLTYMHGHVKTHMYMYFLSALIIHSLLKLLSKFVHKYHRWMCNHIAKWNYYL